MIPEAQKDVLSVLQEAIIAIGTKSYSDLHAISDHILHAIAIYQDKDTVDLAVAIYALNKILEIEKYKVHPKMKNFTKNILNLFKEAAGQVKKKDYAGYSNTLKEILNKIADFTKSIKFYIEDILHFARIKKGTKLYEHGLSLGKAAELVGVTKWELMPAIGETAIHEQLGTPRDIGEQKIAFVKKLFKKNKKRGRT